MIFCKASYHLGLWYLPQVVTLFYNFILNCLTHLVTGYQYTFVVGCTVTIQMGLLAFLLLAMLQAVLISRSSVLDDWYYLRYCCKLFGYV